ncbi:DNA methyltransferase [Macrococcoides goetzii]|uniref:DNA methyltransferase n=1 Tax=Macrococcus sp. PK TaxID=2801919 RepID=UPI001F0D891F|nr:site-specific DNA-methyltransferase [Macrococcus sp. PK]MCH4985778.1 site-specific DNA-methyltransferase [Macrococcus sp. PK]
MNTNILDEISKVLNGIEKYWINNKLAKQVIIEDLRNNDINLLSKLLSNITITKTYVQDVDGYKIFDKEAFISMLRYKNYWQDSYTKYTNKIGLTSNGKFLNYNSDVILDFPFKDCVLEGGMTKEDSVLKNNEKFYNQVIAKNEIDTLFSPKVLQNSIKYNRENSHYINTIEEKENLILKGNNLIALHSLKKRFNKKIKSIFIDPPYNTNNDSFKYNDRFNESTWLTFMKNRLEVAKDLLSDDGSISVVIDHHELAPLMLLCNEIFGKNNLQNIVTIKRSSASGAKVINKGLVNVSEYIIIYSRNSELWKPNRVYSTKERDKRYNSFLINRDDHYSQWQYTTLLEAFAKDKNIPKRELKKVLGNDYEIQLEEFVLNNVSKVFQFVSLDDNQISKKAKEIKKLSKKNPQKYFKIEREDYKDYYIKNGSAILFLEDRLVEIDGLKTFGSPATDIWTDVLPNDLHNEGGVVFKKGKKPEKLVRRIIEMTSNENDIVLDFFAGSGTTGAVALKLNRRFILIEQMDYINNITINRLQNTLINKKNNGISNDIKWQGGGSFIYAELAKENQEIIENIIRCDTKEELNQQIDDLLSNGVLNYEVDFDKFTSTKKEFHELKLEDQKEVLIRVLDSNQLYVNYADIEDSSYNFTEDEIAFNHSFYGGE